MDIEYKNIKEIVDKHIGEFKDSIYKVEAYYSLTEMTEEERFKNILYGIAEIYEKYRKEKWV